MRSSILPIVALALLLMGAGAFATWFIMSQDADAPKLPAISVADSEDPQRIAPDLADPVIDRPLTPEEKSAKAVPEAKESAGVAKADTTGALEAEERAVPPEAPGNPSSPERAETVRKLAEEVAKMRSELEIPDVEALENAPKVPFAATISGTVVDTTGSPVAGAQIVGSIAESLTSGTKGVSFRMVSSAASQASGPVLATTLGDGSFTIEIKREVREGASVGITLTARAAGFAESRSQYVGVRNGDNKEGIKLQVRGAGSVSGRVVDGSGNGVEGARVHLSASEGAAMGGSVPILAEFAGASSSSAVTDSAGYFLIKEVAEGRYSCSMRTTGWRAVAGPSEVTVAAGVEAKLPADFIVAAVSTLRATLTTPDGKPARGYARIAFKEGARQVKQTGVMVGEGGVITLNDPPAGTFSVEITLHGYHLVTATGVFTDGQPTDLGTLVATPDPEAKTGTPVVIPGFGG